MRWKRMQLAGDIMLEGGKVMWKSGQYFSGSVRKISVWRFSCWQQKVTFGYNWELGLTLWPQLLFRPRFFTWTTQARRLVCTIIPLQKSSNGIVWMFSGDKENKCYPHKRSKNSYILYYYFYFFSLDSFYRHLGDYVIDTLAIVSFSSPSKTWGRLGVNFS